MSELSVLFFSCSVTSDSLQPHGLQHTRLLCPSPSPRACSESCPLSEWCHPTISFSVIPFSSCLQSFSASESFLMMGMHQNMFFQTYLLYLDAGKDWLQEDRGQQRMKWLDSITDSVDRRLSKLHKTLQDRDVWHAAVHGIMESDTPEQLNNSNWMYNIRSECSLKLWVLCDYYVSVKDYSS